MQSEVSEEFKVVSSPRPAENRQREICPRCEHLGLKRRPRIGLGQRWVFSVFGYYPWHCMSCGGNFLLKKRGIIKRANSTASDLE